jgi:hypothetical protein
MLRKFSIITTVLLQTEFLQLRKKKEKKKKEEFLQNLLRAKQANKTTFQFNVIYSIIALKGIHGFMEKREGDRNQ